MADLFENPMGLCGFDFVNSASPEWHLGAGVYSHGLHLGRQAPLKGRRAVAPRWDQPPRTTKLRCPLAIMLVSTVPQPARWVFASKMQRRPRVGHSKRR